MSACQEDDSGKVDYLRIAPQLAAMIFALIDAQGQEVRASSATQRVGAGRALLPASAQQPRKAPPEGVWLAQP